MSLSVNLSSLRSEFSSDPSGLGYATYRGSNPQQLMYLINTVSVNSNSTNSTISLGVIYSIQLQQVVIGSNYSTLTSTQQNLWNAVITTAIQGLAISNSTVRGQLSFIWSGTSTGIGISALFTRSASRAEVLFGESAAVNMNEAVKADQGDF